MIFTTLQSGILTSDIQKLIDNESAKYAPSMVYNMDNVAGMKHYPDNHFDLAVVDPPYGINIAKTGKVGGGKCAKVSDYGAKDWDSEPPPLEYFCELFRVSKNQIVWGANHYISRMPYDSSCWIIWDKDNTGNFADAELAWTSFKSPVRIVKYRWNGMLQQNMKDKEIRIHPTQKPVGLYDWIYDKYAEKGQRVLDTHLGSGSNRISANKAGLDFTGFEIDKDYYEEGEARFKKFISQTRLF